MTQDFFFKINGGFLSWYMKQLYIRHNHDNNNLLEMLTSANKAADQQHMWPKDSMSSPEMLTSLEYVLRS